MRNIKIPIGDTYDDTLRVLDTVRHAVAHTLNEYLNRRFEEVNFEHELMINANLEVQYPDGWRVKPYATSRGIVSECDLTYTIGNTEQTVYGVMAPGVDHLPVFQLSFSSHLLIDTVIYNIATKRKIYEYRD